MSRVKVFDRGGLSQTQMDRDLWFKVDETLLNEEKRILFLKRKEAIDLYVNNEKSLKEIFSCTGIDRRNLIRLYNRCISYDENALPWGYRALIPGKNIKKYELDPLSKKSNISRKTGNSIYYLINIHKLEMK